MRNVAGPADHLTAEEEIIYATLQAGAEGMVDPYPFDLGPSLPACYQVDRLYLMIQSPFRLYAYWELTAKVFQRTLRYFPREDRDQFRLIIRCFPEGKPANRWFDVGAVSHWWFEAAPNMGYQVQLCFYSPEYGVFPLLSSNRVKTPPNGLGSPSENGEEKAATLPLLERLMQMTGVAVEVPQQFATPSPSPSPALQETAAIEIPAASLPAATPPEETAVQDATEPLPATRLHWPTSPGKEQLPE